MKKGGISDEHNRFYTGIDVQKCKQRGLFKACHHYGGTTAAGVGPIVRGIRHEAVQLRNHRQKGITVLQFNPA